MENSTNRAFFNWVMLAVTLAIFGCGDQSQKDADSYQDGVTAFSNGDFSLALEKFKQPAEHGHAQAQYNLGVMYLQGKGIAKDDKAAGVLLNKAAEQGHIEAQESLGLIYAKGLGVERDWVQADKWYNIAAASGKETAINNKKVIEVHMPPEKIAEANVLAQEWLAKHKK